MTLTDSRRPSPADVPAREPRSGCALKHTVSDCDCIPPDSQSPKVVGCSDCWGNGDFCGNCGGWGEVYARSGNWVHTHVAGSGATGPSSTVPDDDPWAVVVIDAWADPDHTDEPPFFCAVNRPHGRFEMPC